MSEKLYKILAVNPGSRYLGIAYFHGFALRQWQVRSIRSQSPKAARQKATAFLDRFMDQYPTDVLALKMLHPSRSSKQLDRLTDEIKDFAKAKKRRLYAYSLEELEAFLCNEHFTKQHLVRAVVKQYPGLLYEYRKEQYNRGAYYMRVFEAVALGQLCADWLDKK